MEIKGGLTKLLQK